MAGEMVGLRIIIIMCSVVTVKGAAVIEVIITGAYLEIIFGRDFNYIFNT